MAIICPCVTPTTIAEFDKQLKNVESFAKHVHFDFMDGKLAPITSPGLDTAHWPKTIKADLHLMYQDPTKKIRQIVNLRPHMVIVHAEADGDFMTFAKIIRRLGIKVGLALKPETAADAVFRALEHIDHVMIFSGDLGHYGGRADLSLLAKAQVIKQHKPDIELGWDGGINDANAHLLVAGGIDVLNVGGYIQKASDPAAAYATLKTKLR